MATKTPNNEMQTVIVTRSFSEMLEDLVNRATDKTSLADLNTGSAIDALSKALEASMFYGWPVHEQGLRRTLGKLGIKSAREARAGSLAGGAPLQMESLEATLKQVEFDDKKLKLWKDIK